MTKTLWTLVLLAGAFVFLPVGGAEASCAGPMLQVVEAFGEGPPTVRTGTTFAVAGRGFVEGCDDTGGGSVLGCSSDDGETETPLEDVALTIRQRGQSWDLGAEDAGTADDDRLGKVSWQVSLPAGVEPGRATLVADGARLRIAVGPGR
jgi:hypothetical protein